MIDIAVPPPPTLAEQIAALEKERRAAVDELVAALVVQKRAEKAWMALRADAMSQGLRVHESLVAISRARERGDRATIKLTAIEASLPPAEFARVQKEALNLLVGAREAIDGDVC